MSYQHFERLYDFSGGLNNRDADALLQNNESPDLCNIVLGKRGTFETRPGTAYFRDTPVNDGEPVTSIFECLDADGEVVFLAFAGDKMMKATQDGWTEVTGSGLTAGTYLDFVVYPTLNKNLFVNGEDGYFETDGDTYKEVEPYDPTEQEMTEIGDCMIPEKPKLICYHKGRIWMANVEGQPDYIYISLEDITGNTLHNYFTPSLAMRLDSPKGEGVTAMVSFKDRLYIFTRSSIWVVVGDGDDQYDFVLVNHDPNIGAISQRSVHTFGGYMIFTGIDGVYIYDGANPPMKVSGRLPSTIDKMAADYSHLSCGIIHQGKYYLSIPESTVNDVTLVYDTEVVPLTYIGEKHSYANAPWVLHRGYVPAEWIVGRDMNLYFASNDGYVYQYGIGDTDVGKMISAYYTTKLIDIDMPDRAKRTRRLILDARREKESFIRIDYRVDSEDSEWEQFREEIDLSEPIDRMFFTFPGGRGPLCRKIAFRFSTVYVGGRFRVNGFTLDMAVHGHQEERT